ncbi:hypothetical protein A3F28_02040 [Candidatus Uhrbacteria bacterium RIFCSPHIGHO2_12_FULL_57_11]|uniref:Proline--tRNA ligase n=2 Tax=Candidatus Uhriibacteriota TaxID=1752732 RepID=A0A1F7UMR3_9BACT|nr:MAG: hypothetical protein A3D72_03180 [Candidatus Uhrbacteria bacterium RIFCSPHIGHO2_02_FULL_57_19]OGL79570.1 MAG: hypothetical protein A3F28_02040 [Candidatus Uhrbacteria bacterium RIFCSPHIGHO2_12_FULL_57_11]
MRYSKLFGKSRKSIPTDAESANAKYLLKGGFVEQLSAGIYTWLPLGLRVLRKVENIVRQEMENLGAQELLMPALHPKENWEKTGRWKTMDVLFKVKSQTGKEYALGATHEEVITPLVARFVQSYKDLPVHLYQIQTKYRDELRAKSGVLRGREFGMKDLYSFHRNHEELQAFYPEAIRAYNEIMNRMGMEIRVTEASGGPFTEKYSHEFHILTPAGEDALVICGSCDFAQNKEISKFKKGGECPKCGKTLSEAKGIEVGNIFDLGTKFADTFELSFTDEEGKKQKVWMGCYGFGTTRMVGAVVEASHDERGIVWPKSIAPFDVQVVEVKSKKPEVRAAAEDLIRDLEQHHGVDVLYDDRDDASAGEKFADADLIGIPLRLVVSEKTLAKDSVEWKFRAQKEATLFPSKEVVGKVVEWVNA